MIKNNEPISMIESLEYLKEAKEEGKEIVAFIKKFNKLSQKDGKEMREKLRKVDVIRLDEKSISKIIDTLPDNGEDLNKIFVGMSLDEEEIKKVLDVVREIK
jgi:DNA-directed RNA polymerase subunit F